MPTSPDDITVRPPGASSGAALRRGWPLVLLVAIAAVAASLYTASRRVPQFDATANLVISPLGQSESSLFGTSLIRDAGDAAQTPNTVAVLIRTSRAAEGAAKVLGGRWTAGDVLDAVRVEPVPNANVVAVVARTRDPRASADVATAFARSVIRDRRRLVVPQLEARLERSRARRRRAPEDDYSQRDRLLTEIRLLENSLSNDGDPTLQLVEPAVAPRSATATSPIITGALGLLGGLAVGCAAVVALDRLRRPVAWREPVTA